MSYKVFPPSYRRRRRGTKGIAYDISRFNTGSADPLITPEEREKRLKRLADLFKALNAAEKKKPKKRKKKV